MPIYILETHPFFDPVREQPEFQAILADYDTYLAPMRERVIQATETGDWESLRQRTTQWIRGDLDIVEVDVGELIGVRLLE